MVIKLKIERHIEKPKMAPVKLKIERVLDTPAKVKRVYKKRALKEGDDSALKKRAPRKKKADISVVEIPIMDEDIHETRLVVKEDDEAEVLPVIHNELISDISTDVVELPADLSRLPGEAFEVNTAPLIEEEVSTPENMIEEKLSSAIEEDEKNQSF